MKVYYTTTEKDGQKYVNYYLGIEKADGTLAGLIPIKVQYFDTKSYSKSMTLIKLVAVPYKKGA